VTGLSGGHDINRLYLWGVDVVNTPPSPRPAASHEGGLTGPELSPGRLVAGLNGSMDGQLAPMQIRSEEQERQDADDLYRVRIRKPAIL
jgi:hypothetical protein